MKVTQDSCAMIFALLVIPTSEPYTSLGYTFIGGGNESIDPSVLTVTGDDAIVDWVILELRDKTTPATILKSRAALIQRDGDIVDLDGKSTIVIFSNTPIGFYHLAVRHRNHLGVATLDPLFMSPSACAIDFTKNSTLSWGTNAQDDIGNGKLGLWAGDANRDGQINAVDRNLYWRVQNGAPYIYLSSSADFNMDTAVNAVDRNLYWRVNNSIIQQLP